MKRVVLVAAIFLTACTTPTVGGSTASPLGTASAAKASASPLGSPTAGRIMAAQLHCRLPVMTSGTFDPRASTSPGAVGQGATLGFFRFPDGPAVTDSADVIRFNSSRFRYLTLREPVLESGAQALGASWDTANSRWVPVERGLLSPDESEYAWTEDPSPKSPLSRTHITRVSDGHDRVVLTSGSGTNTDLGYGVVRYEPGGLLLTLLSGSEGGIFNSNHGLWRFDFTSGKVSQVIAKTVSWQLLSPDAAWVSDTDPEAGSPVAAPTPDVGPMPNRLMRVDLTSGNTTTWISRPGHIVMLLGVDLLDHPLLRIQATDSTEIYYSSAPDQTALVYRSGAPPLYGPSTDWNATGAGYRPHQLMVDTHGVWLARGSDAQDKLFLFNPARGLEELPRFGNFDTAHWWNPAGPCTE